MSNQFFSNSSIQWQTKDDDESELVIEDIHNLIVWNDDVNTLDWVIESLVDICKHDSIQAEQCALIAHYKGKCSVKNGDFDTLKPLAEALLDRGISATIDS